MQSQNLRFVAEVLHSCGVITDAGVLVVGEAQSDLEGWFAERGVTVTSVAALEHLRELDAGSYGFVVGDRPSPGTGNGALEELRRVAETGVILTAAANGVTAETEARPAAAIESYFSGLGDRVMVVAGVLLALRTEPLSDSGQPTAPGDERLALLSVCLAQAAVAEAAGHRLDAAIVRASHLSDELARAEAENAELASKLAQAVNTLRAEREEHEVLRRRVAGWRASRAWPILVVSYNIVHAGRTLRARWSRRSGDA